MKTEATLIQYAAYYRNIWRHILDVRKLDVSALKTSHNVIPCA